MQRNLQFKSDDEFFRDTNQFSTTEIVDDMTKIALSCYDKTTGKYDPSLNEVYNVDLKQKIIEKLRKINAEEATAALKSLTEKKY